MDALFASMLKEYRFPGDQPWIAPAYGGRSIINFMSSVLACFGIEYGVPLKVHEAFHARIAGRRKIIFLFVDGLGWLNMQHVSRQNPRVANFLSSAACWPLTSVSPSTTSSASASFLTALPPAMHGVLGFLMYFPEYQRVFNMLTFQSPTVRGEELTQFGFRPEDYFESPTVLALLDRAGINANAYTYAGYAGSGLSRLLYCHQQPHPYVALGDLFSRVLQQIQGPSRQFQLLYWSNLDTVAHNTGACSEAFAIELSLLIALLRDEIFPRLDEDTAFIICADHGHIDGNDNEAIDLSSIPGLLDLFRMVPAGEGRETHLFIRSGEVEHARELLEIAGHMQVFTREAFLDSGLLGGYPTRPEIQERLGDLVVFPHGSRRTLFPYEPRPHTAMIGRHGGLSPEEMLVPLLVW